jgi:ATP-binding cassette, subfamily B, beta-glucan exporter
VPQALTNLKQGRTTFIILHRLATIRDADLILVFQERRIIERGRFQELVRQGRYFARLVAAQFQTPAASEALAARNETAGPFSAGNV